MFCRLIQQAEWNARLIMRFGIKDVQVKLFKQCMLQNINSAKIMLYILIKQSADTVKWVNKKAKTKDEFKPKALTTRASTISDKAENRKLSHAHMKK